MIAYATARRSRYPLTTRVCAVIVTAALAGAGCAQDDRLSTVPAPSSTPAPVSLDDHSQETTTLLSPDRKWTVKARTGPDESFDLIGPKHSTTIHQATALEFSPDSTYLLYLQTLTAYGRSALFVFDTTSRASRQVTNTNLPPAPLEAQYESAMIYGPRGPIAWRDHVITWTFRGKETYELNLDTGTLVNRTSAVE